jgi:hypothetical protein
VNSSQTDLGEPIRAYVESGYINHDTDTYKHCTHVRVTLKRGTTSSEDEPQAWLKWRDRPGPYLSQVQIRLGRSAESEPVVQLDSLGTYRRRQWAFEFSGSEELSLVSVTEEFELS